MHHWTVGELSDVLALFDGWDVCYCIHNNNSTSTDLHIYLLYMDNVIYLLPCSHFLLCTFQFYRMVRKHTISSAKKMLLRMYKVTLHAYNLKLV